MKAFFLNSEKLKPTNSVSSLSFITKLFISKTCMFVLERHSQNQNSVTTLYCKCKHFTFNFSLGWDGIIGKLNRKSIFTPFPLKWLSSHKSWLYKPVYVCHTGLSGLIVYWIGKEWKLLQIRSHSDLTCMSGEYRDGCIPIQLQQDIIHKHKSYFYDSTQTVWRSISSLHNFLIHIIIIPPSKRSKEHFIRFWCCCCCYSDRALSLLFYILYFLFHIWTPFLLKLYTKL